MDVELGHELRADFGADAVELRKRAGDEGCVEEVIAEDEDHGCGGE